MHYQKRRPPEGARPGTLILPEGAPAPRLRVLRYGPESFEERDLEDAREIDGLLEEGQVLWLDVQGLGDEATLRHLAEVFRVHPLALEDIVNAPQRPKSHAYEHNHLLITRHLELHDDVTLRQEQVSLLVGEGYVVSFQEDYSDAFAIVRERLKSGHNLFRETGADYLAYALIDTIIDSYYPVLERLSDHLERLDARVLDPKADAIAALSQAKHTITQLRRVLWPQRDVMNRITRDDVRFLSPRVRLFFRDVHDHTEHAVEVVESFREVVTSQMSVYLSVVSNRTNNIMRVLTIISTIFIPLTFISGVYGMNFRHMPELQQPWGYPAVLLFMLVISLGQLLLFWRMGWLRSSQRG